MGPSNWPMANAAVIAGMNSINVGERNTKFVMDFLSMERIPVVSKDVMDIFPRKVCYLPASGKAMVKRLAPTNPEALAAQGSFPPVYVTVIAAGERSGNLTGVLDQYISYLRISTGFTPPTGLNGPIAFSLVLRI